MGMTVKRNGQMTKKVPQGEEHRQFLLFLALFIVIAAAFYIYSSQEDANRPMSQAAMMELRNNIDNFIHFIGNDGSDTVDIGAQSGKNVIFEDFSLQERDKIKVNQQFKNWEELKPYLYFDGYDTLLLTRNHHIVVLRGLPLEDATPEIFIFR